MLLDPVTLTLGGNVSISTELQSIVGLVSLSRDGNDLVGTQSLGPQDSEVAETTNADNTDALAGAAAVLLQGAVGGNTGAHHGSSQLGGDGVGDLDDEVTGGSVVQSITTLGDVAVQVLALVCANPVVRAGVLSTGIAVLARSVGSAEARVALSTDTDAVANLDILDLGANTDSGTDDLVADAGRVGGGALYNVLDCYSGNIWLQVMVASYPSAAESVHV